MRANTLLITGANRGIGLEFTRQYAEAGWQVFASTRDIAQAPALQALAAQYTNVQMLSLDVSNVEAIQACAQQLADVSLDLLISNAGVYPESTFGQTKTQDWLHAFQINTLATYYLAEQFLPHLKRAATPKLVAITSKMGSLSDNTSGGEYIYRSSKTALNMVVKSLSIDLRPHGIIVSSLHPGWVRTDMGGPNGLIDTATSIAGLRRVIAHLEMSHSGEFIAFDGQAIAW